MVPLAFTPWRAYMDSYGPFMEDQLPHGTINDSMYSKVE